MVIEKERNVLITENVAYGLGDAADKLLIGLSLRKVLGHGLTLVGLNLFLSALSQVEDDLELAIEELENYSQQGDVVAAPPTLNFLCY